LPGIEKEEKEEKEMKKRKEGSGNGLYGSGKRKVYYNSQKP